MGRTSLLRAQAGRHAAVRLAGVRPRRRRASPPRRPSTATSSTSRRRAPGSAAWSTPSSRRCRGAEDGVLLLLQERSIAEKMDRQLTHRSAARSVTALGAMLAHEIKNPLSGIRGAAQLLETSASDEDRGADPADLRGDRPHRQTGRPDAGVLRRAAGRAREPQHPCGARSREAARAGRLRPAHPLRRSLRSLAAARPGFAGLS